jgi:cytochrome c oxidase subunit 2
MLNKFQISTMPILWLGLLIDPIKTVASTNNWQLNMYKGVTPLSHSMYNLHIIAMIVCALIGIVVFGVMIYSLIYHRKSKGVVPATFHSNARLEIFWSFIPFLILLGLAIPATKILIKMDDSSESDVTIKIIGSQWKWQYQYLDQGISYVSYLSTPYNQIHNKEKKGKWYLLEVDKPLVLPINKKIRFLVTSSDVIHSWWVPKLGVKRDAIPGFMHESWALIEKPGTYRGQCTELCGINHAFMPIVVQAVNQDEFDKWVSLQPKIATPHTTAKTIITNQVQSTMSHAALMTMGKTTYEQVCSACHQADGNGLPPMYPALKGSSVAVGKPISRHINILLHGVPGSAMQAYQDQLTDAEIAAVITYERNSWGNNTGDFVQPNDVTALRQEDRQPPTIVNKAQAGGMR